MVVMVMLVLRYGNEGHILNPLWTIPYFKLPSYSLNSQFPDTKNCL